MTFTKWRSYSYKPLEPKHKRRHTIGTMKSIRRPQQSHISLALARADGEISDFSAEDDVPRRVPVDTEDGATTGNGYALSPPPPPPAAADTFQVESPADTSSLTTDEMTPTLSRASSRRRSRSLSVGLASLRSRLSLRHRHVGGVRQLRSSVSPSPEREVGPQEASSSDAEFPDTATSKKRDELDGLPESDAQLEALLEDAWSSVIAVAEAGYTGFLRRRQALEYGRRMAEFRHQYQLRLDEILQREATFVRGLLSHDESTPLLSADEMNIPVELQKAVCEAQSSGTFDKQRLELKRETVASVLALQSRYPTVLAGKRRGGRGGEKPGRPISCHWPSASGALVYTNPRSDMAQSGSMVGIYDGLYATDNNSDHHLSRPRQPVDNNSL